MLNSERTTCLVVGGGPAGTAQVADYRRLSGTHQYIALVPQWDFLDLLADAALEGPTFTLCQGRQPPGSVTAAGRGTSLAFRSR